MPRKPQAPATRNIPFSTSSELMNPKRKPAQREENQQRKQHFPVEILAHAEPP
jgi:hypothetical protein